MYPVLFLNFSHNFGISYEPFKKINIINELPPRFTLIKSVACALALLASGQAIAAGTCTSNPSAMPAVWNDPASWLDGTAGGASCDGSSVAPGNTDDAVIDGPMMVGFAVTINNLTVNAGKTLSLGGNLTIDGTATINGSIDYMSGTLSPKITSIGELFIATLSGAYTLPTTVTSLGGGVSVSGGALTLAAANIVTKDIGFTAAGSIAGVLKLAPTGNHIINALSGGSAIPSLDLSGATANKKITGFGGILTLDAVTFPSAASKQITFTASASSMNVPVPAATVAICYNNGSTTAEPVGVTTVAAGTSMVCTTPAGSTIVNAPVDLHFSKQVETYSTEIELK